MSKFDIGIDLGTTNVKIFVKDRDLLYINKFINKSIKNIR